MNKTLVFLGLTDAALAATPAPEIVCLPDVSSQSSAKVGRTSNFNTRFQIGSSPNSECLRLSLDQERWFDQVKVDRFMRVGSQNDLHPSMEELNNRELQVFLPDSGRGKITRYIALELGLGSVTINTFSHRTMKRLDLKNSFELVLQADRWVHEGNHSKNN